MRAYALTALCCGVLACSDDGSLISVDTGTPAVDLGTSPVDAGVVDTGMVDSGVADAGVADTGTPDTGTPDSGVMITSPCQSLNLPTRSFQTASSTFEFGDVAGDFTVNLLDGSTWNLQQNFSGCGSYIFVTYAPSRPTGDGSPTVTETFWASPVTDLVASPVNAHYFFNSWEQTEAERRDRVSAIQNRIEQALMSANLTDAQLAQQRARFHYGLDDPRAIQGSVGAWFNDYLRYFNDPDAVVDLGDRGRAPPPFPNTVAIDREQKWDSVGSLSEFVGGPWALRMVSYLPAFYDHKAGLADQVASESGIDTHVLVDEVVTERIFVRTATLAAGSSMASYDTLEFDVGVNCRERNVFACSEWDRIARISLCLDGAACAERREVVRWITPYWRRGSRRWIMDASGLLGLVSGGVQYFRIEMGPGWERKTPRNVRIALRLSNQGKPERATGALRAFTGGNWDFDYNARQAPFAFTPPASARKVELVVILSGHGQASNTNCAEWCDHRHVFSVNGTALPEIQHTGRIGSVGGCGPAAGLGVSPGQYGNWAPERAYWCPGQPVDHIRVDITNEVTLGMENTLNYGANFQGRPFSGGGNISLNAYVTWSE